MPDAGQVSSASLAVGVILGHEPVREKKSPKPRTRGGNRRKESSTHGNRSGSLGIAFATAMAVPVPTLYPMPLPSLRPMWRGSSGTAVVGQELQQVRQTTSITFARAYAIAQATCEQTNKRAKPSPKTLFALLAGARPTAWTLFVCSHRSFGPKARGFARLLARAGGEGGTGMA